MYRKLEIQARAARISDPFLPSVGVAVELPPQQARPLLHPYLFPTSPLELPTQHRVEWRHGFPTLHGKERNIPLESRGLLRFEPSP
jgi:hypothetical protein